jgi:lambda family phage portal protein
MARGRPPKPETLVARAAVALLHKQKGLQPKAKYDAAGHGRRLAGWNPPASGPNRAIEGLQTIRNRARDSSRNDWSGVSATEKWTTNLVGIGITPRFKRVLKARKQAIVDLWEDFVQQCDADGVMNLYGLQTLVTRAWLDGGEAFIRRRARYEDEGLTVPLQIQVMEAEMVPMLDATGWPGLPVGNEIKSGIEFNRRGRRIAYWVFKQHPGDKNGSVVDPTQLVRVAASDMIHVFEPIRPGQLRGVSMMAPLLTRLRNIENYDDATLTRQQLANLIVAFISRKLPEMSGDEDISPLTGEEIQEDSTGTPLVGLQPGLVQELEDGQEVQWSNPPEAGTNYSDYMRTQHLGTAAGAGLPYEIFSGDIKDVSDRTLRVIINDFRRHAEQRQWQVLIPQMCKRVIGWFAESAALIGKIATDEIDAITRAEWSPHGWAHIHPVQDPQGKKLEVDAGFRSRSSVIGQYGDDPDAVDDERASDMTREKELGLWVEAPGSVAEGDADGIDNSEYSAPPNALQQAQIRALEAVANRPPKDDSALTERILALLGSADASGA